MRLVRFAGCLGLTLAIACGGSNPPTSATPPGATVTAVQIGIAGNATATLVPGETRQLFAYVEIESEERWAAVAKTEVCQRWWKYMGDIMPSNPDHSPVANGLDEVFHLD